ncbi:hypothetical protein RI367_003667 [Sorochytrium milnesiophthora]
MMAKKPETPGSSRQSSASAQNEQSSTTAPLSAAAVAEAEEARLRLEREHAVIRELDATLQDKQDYLAKLVQQRRELEVQNGTSINPSDYEKEMNRKKHEVLKILMGTLQVTPDIQPGTFLTELGVKGDANEMEQQQRQGRQAKVKETLKNLREVTAEDMKRKRMLESSKDFVQGDFVQRNKALGVDARYFGTLNETEMQRVESVLQNEELEPPMDESTSETASRAYTAVSAGFLPDEGELTRLDDIHRRLSQIIPAHEWEIKSVTMSAQHSGMQTPMSSITTRSSVSKSTILSTIDWEKELDKSSTASGSSDADFRRTVMEETKRLKELEIELATLRQAATEQAQEVVPLSRTELDELLSSCLHSERMTPASRSVSAMSNTDTDTWGMSAFSNLSAHDPR